MSGLDRYLRNGTCYFAPGKKSSTRMLPCGNSGLEHIQCFEEGQTCLEHGACSWDMTIIYVAGCTDPSYEHESFPDKAIFSDQHWTALGRCHDVPSWIPMSIMNPKEAPTRQTMPVQGVCQPSKTGIWDAAITDPAFPHVGVAELPRSSGGPVTPYVSGTPITGRPTSPGESGGSNFIFAADANEGATGLSTGQTPITGRSASPSETGGSKPMVATDDTDEGVTGLSVGQKTGIGVGAALTGLLTLAVIALVFRFRGRVWAGRDTEPETHKVVCAGPTCPPWSPGAETRAAGLWTLVFELEGTAGKRPGKAGSGTGSGEDGKGEFKSEGLGLRAPPTVYGKSEESTGRRDESAVELPV